MGQICDCFYRWHHHHNRIEQLENKILEYEQFMEQWLVNNSCCEIAPYNRNTYKQINRQMKPKDYIARNINKSDSSDRYTVARILVFKTYELIQSNNGCYILFDEIDEETINDIYNFKTKL